MFTEPALKRVEVFDNYQIPEGIDEPVSFQLNINTATLKQLTRSSIAKQLKKHRR